MSYFVDQQNRCVSAGLRALDGGKFHEAFVQFNTAAECSLNLAEKSEGTIAQAHLARALELTDLAEHCLQSKKTKRTRPVAEGTTPSSEQEESASSRASKWILTEKPTERLEDVAGLEKVKRVIEDVILLPMQHGADFREHGIPPGGGALMYGPPGTGKTFIAKAIAGSLDMPFLFVSGSDIKDKYVGETEKNMRALFEEAAKYDRAIIFIDEIHAILGRRGNEKVNAVDEFRIRADGIATRKNDLFILGATNEPWMLDVAVVRRLKKLIHVHMPDREARKKIFELQFPDAGLREDGFPFGEFADRSERFSGDDIKQISSAAKIHAIRRKIEKGADSSVVSKEDVFSAIKAQIPTVSQKTIERYYKWEAEQIV